MISLGRFELIASISDDSLALDVNISRVNILLAADSFRPVLNALSNLNKSTFDIFTINSDLIIASIIWDSTDGIEVP